MLTVCTGWHPAGWTQYAHRFVESFRQFWPADVRLIAFVEVPQDVPRVEVRSLWSIPGTREFQDRHAGNPAACGRAPAPHWKDRDRQKGYSFRYDAVKFYKQGFIPLAAAELAGDGLLAWFDADVVFHAKVDPEAVARLLPKGADVAYLGRPPKHSEIGFQLYRLPGALPHLRAFRDLYATDAVFGLRETHSAFAFDTALASSGVRGHNLTPNGSGDVWRDSPLRAFSTHLKGDRKFRR